jgi:hypothetical protein
MVTQSSLAAEPEEILADLLGLDSGLRREVYYGERAIFYNPNCVAPLGRIFASIKDHDGPNDKAGDLSRPGVYRFAFCLTRLQPDAHRPADPAPGLCLDALGANPVAAA